MAGQLPSLRHQPSSLARVQHLQQPTELMEYIVVLEKALGKTAEKQLLPLHAGDVPDTKVEEGIQLFVAWYRNEFKFI
jgi:hypothetical protein